MWKGEPSGSCEHFRLAQDIAKALADKKLQDGSTFELCVEHGRSGTYTNIVVFVGRI